MSLQDGTEDKSKVGELVQDLIDSSPYEDEHTHIYVHYADGTWYVTRDHK
jgi:hypothetical protein